MLVITLTMNTMQGVGYQKYISGARHPCRPHGAGVGHHAAPGTWLSVEGTSAGRTVPVQDAGYGLLTAECPVIVQGTRYPCRVLMQSAQHQCRVPMSESI